MNNHPFRIYTQAQDGKHLIATGDWRAVEAFRECCRNIVVEDIANDFPHDLEATRPQDYGVRDYERNFFSACVVFACMVLVPLLTLAAFFIENQ